MSFYGLRQSSFKLLEDRFIRYLRRYYLLESADDHGDPPTEAYFVNKSSLCYVCNYNIGHSCATSQIYIQD